MKAIGALNACLLAAAVSACESPTAPRTEIMVVVTTDFETPGEIDQVRVRIDSETKKLRFDKVYEMGPGLTMAPFSMGLVPGEDGAVGFTVAVAGMSKGDMVVERAATTSFVAGQTLELRIELLKACNRVACGRGETCGRDGKCAPDEVEPTMLPKYAGKADGGGAGAEAGAAGSGGTGGAGGMGQAGADGSASPDGGMAGMGGGGAGGQAGVDGGSDSTMATPDAPSFVNCNTVTSMGCDAGLKCAFDKNIGCFKFCGSPGTLAYGDTCVNDLDCGPGLHCSSTSTPGVFKCNNWCNSNADCVGGATCVSPISCGGGTYFYRVCSPSP